MDTRKIRSIFCNHINPNSTLQYDGPTVIVIQTIKDYNRSKFFMFTLVLSSVSILGRFIFLWCDKGSINGLSDSVKYDFKVSSMLLSMVMISHILHSGVTSHVSFLYEMCILKGMCLHWIFYFYSDKI